MVFESHPTAHQTKAVLVAERNARLRVLVEAPAEASRGVVVIVPGRVESLGRGASAKTGAGLLAEGWTVVSFDWGFHAHNPKAGSHDVPQADTPDALQGQVAELETVVDYLRGPQGVAEDELVLLGRRMGAVVAYQVFLSDESFAALVLQDPVCGSRLETVFPGLAELRRPVRFFHIGRRCSAQWTGELVAAAKSTTALDPWPENEDEARVLSEWLRANLHEDSASRRRDGPGQGRPDGVRP